MIIKSIFISHENENANADENNCNFICLNEK